MDDRGRVLPNTLSRLFFLLDVVVDDSLFFLMVVFEFPLFFPASNLM